MRYRAFLFLQHQNISNVQEPNHRLFLSASTFLKGHPLVPLSAPVRRLTRLPLSPANMSTHKPNTASTLAPRQPNM